MHHMYVHLGSYFSDQFIHLHNTKLTRYYIMNAVNIMYFETIIQYMCRYIGIQNTGYPIENKKNVNVVPKYISKIRPKRGQHNV